MSNPSFPNVFHGDKWSVNFSNLPTISAMGDMRMYDLYVKSLVFPDYNLEEIYSDIKGFRIRHPMAGQKSNVDLSQVQIEFKLSEDMKNYINLFEWMRSLKYGHVEEFSAEQEFFRKYTIKSININILDNEKRPIAVWRLTEAFLLTLGSLPLSMGTSDEVSFTANFSYEEIKYETKSVFSG